MSQVASGCPCSRRCGLTALKIVYLLATVRWQKIQLKRGRFTLLLLVGAVDYGLLLEASAGECVISLYSSDKAKIINYYSRNSYNDKVKVKNEFTLNTFHVFKCIEKLGPSIRVTTLSAGDKGM